MKVHFLNDTAFATQNAAFLKELGFEEDAAGTPITLTQSVEKKLVVTKKDGSNAIQFFHPVHLFRGLILWQAMAEGNERTGEVQFLHMGPMIDMSRNAVMTVAALKEFLKKQARLGLDRCMLYMEDTYEVSDYPYFGYLRGRYSVAELRELDDFAFNLGIELIPSIQTLGHLQNPMKWEFMNGMKDTSDILLVGEEKTYTFITALLKTMKAAFRTKKIHIGMDEAWSLGSGQYLRKNGYHTQFDIMTTHLARVLDIVKSLDLDPLMWSDMFFRSVSKTGAYYDIENELTPEMKAKIPPVELTLWDYYNTDEAFEEKLLDRHFEMSDKVSFAGGMWIWNSFAPNYGKTMATTKVALEACAKKGVQDIYVTMWGDDGQETSIDSTLFGLSIFANYLFNAEPDIEKAKHEFKLIFNQDADDYLALSAFDETPGIAPGNPNATNTSKLLLYQDLFLDMFAPNFAKMDLKKHYKALEQRLQKVTITADNEKMFTFYRRLAHTLVIKADLVATIKKAYLEKDHAKMEKCLAAIEDLRNNIAALKQVHFDLWHKNYRTFGWEVMDVRYGGLISRLMTNISQLLMWQADDSIVIEPLATPLLPFGVGLNNPDNAVCGAQYASIISPSKLTGV